MKKKINLILPDLLAALTAGSALFLSFGWSFFHFITYGGKKKSDKSRKKWFSLKHTTINHPRYHYAEEYDASKAWCLSQPMEDWYIKSQDGLMLHASWFPVENAKRFVILCHGYRGTRFGSIAHIARYLHEQHSALLFIDQRCCGESEGKYITFGAKEQYDVLSWIKRLEKENVHSLPIYLYGQSMGATTVLLASGHRLPRDVHGIIADCGFHSMKQQLRDIASGWFHLPRIELLLLRMELFCRLFASFSMKETDTTNALRTNDRPVLFFHGAADTYVFPHNSRRNYTLCTAEKELVFSPNAAHLCASYANPALYQEKLSAFFARYDAVATK